MSRQSVLVDAPSPCDDSFSGFVAMIPVADVAVENGTYSAGPEHTSFANLRADKKLDADGIPWLCPRAP